MQVLRLGPNHTSLVRSFLERRLAVNLYLLGVIYQQGVHRRDEVVWLGAFDGSGTLVAVAFASGGAPGGGPLGTAVPEGDPAGCELLGQRMTELGGTHMVVGPREPSDALWKGLGDLPTRIRYDQRLYALDRLPQGDALPVGPARLSELPVILEHSGAMMKEDLGLDPRQVDPEGYRRRIEARIRRGSTLVARQDGQVVFQVDIGTRFPQGAQVGGTYVPPEARGQGVATRGMRGVGRALLAEVPRVTLHVNEANTPAVRCYEAAGFRRDAAFRLVAW